MIMQLELKHLSAYLPYGLKFYWEQLDGTPNKPWTLTINSVDFALEHQNKPILRPLSDLTKEIEHNGEKVNIFNRIEIYKGSGVDYLIEQIRFGFVEVIIYNILLEHHFDVFGLIEKNLAIDINTLNK